MTFLGVVWLIVKVLYLLSVAVVGNLLAQGGERYVEISAPFRDNALTRYSAYVVIAMCWPFLLLASLRFVPRGER